MIDVAGEQEEVKDRALLGQKVFAGLNEFFGAMKWPSLLLSLEEML